MARIFVVDDDSRMLDLVSMTLKRAGYAVTLISNPQKAVEILQREKTPAALVLDLMMPGMSGIEVCRRVRNMPGKKNLPIMVLTARTQDIDRKSALAAGADLFVTKPVTNSELIGHIDRLLGKAPSPKPARDGLVISFFGLRGGSGRTTLAVNLAGALRWLSRRNVCVVDFSPSSGQVTAHLHQKAAQTWMDLPPADAITADNIGQYMATHSSGLQVLAAPVVPVTAQQPDATLATAILTSLRPQMLFTVVDLPPVLNPAVEVALRNSDIVFHVVNPEFVSVRVARKTAPVLDGDAYRSVQKAYLLNQIAADEQLSLASVESSLGTRIAFHIGYDPHQPRALNQGLPQPIEPATSPVPIGVRRLGEVLWQRVQEVGLVTA
jgi:pilus assembly protein CpaE